MKTLRTKNKTPLPMRLHTSKTLDNIPVSSAKIVRATLEQIAKLSTTD